MAATQQQARTDSAVTLKGSAAVVKEFFGDSICSILDQRGIYKRSQFKRVSKYGIPIFVADDPELKSFLNKYMDQVEMWLQNCDLKKLVLVIMRPDTEEAIERWVFDVRLDYDENMKPVLTGVRDKKAIQTDIRTIIRQITMSVTYLPLIEGPVKFDLLAYTSMESETPLEWEVSDAKEIENAEEVALRTLDAAVYQVGTNVQYARGL